MSTRTPDSTKPALKIEPSRGPEEWYEALESWRLALTRSMMSVWPWVAAPDEPAGASSPSQTAATPFRAHSPGKPIEELSVGDSASMSKRFTQDDIDAFARISGDDNPAHVDEEWASASLFGGRVAHGVLTAGLISAVLGTQLPGPGTIYMSQSLKWLAPARPGDLLTVTVTVAEIVESKGRVVLETVVTHDGEPILTGEALVKPPAGEPAEQPGAKTSAGTAAKSSGRPVSRKSSPKKASRPKQNGRSGRKEDA